VAIQSPVVQCEEHAVGGPGDVHLHAVDPRVQSHPKCLHRVGKRIGGVAAVRAHHGRARDPPALPLAHAVEAAEAEVEEGRRDEGE